MIRDLLKWVAPGVVTVLGGTVAALAMATPGMLDTLAREGRDTLAGSGAEWAHIAVSGRHVHLSGTTSSDSERDMAIAGLMSVPGVSAVDETVTIAPLATPYRINVAVEDGSVSLFGDVPNETLRQKLLELPGLASADLQIRSGQPDEGRWLAGVDFALAQADLVESGYFELSGLTLNASGRASSERALGALQMALADLPDGLSSGAIAVEPVRVAPYTWQAEFDGRRIAISGHVPEDKLVERLRMADVSGIPVATGLSLASGAPDGFAERTRILVEQLARLDHGRAEIVDGVTRLTGVPPSIEVAQAVTQALSGTNSIVDLAPPRVADYWVSINRQPGNVLVFDGYVPDETTRKRFAALAGADITFLKYGAGAPESYSRAVDFGLAVLGHLSEGRFSLSANAVSLSGIAQSGEDYRNVLALLRDGLPQGVTLGDMAVQAPRAAAYTFAIRRDAANGVTFEGMLPNPDVEANLLALAGNTARSRVAFASGEPPNFVASAEQAVEFLPWLRRGSIEFDGLGWTLEGEPLSAIDKGSIETEFAVRGLAQSGWTLALTEPAAAPIVADPYIWSAERLPDGSFLFAGNTPAASLQTYFKIHVGTRVADTTVLAQGAPDGFALQARAAVDVLLGLDQGRVDFDGQQWHLSGQAADPSSREAALELAAPLALGEGADITLPAIAAVEPYIWSASKTGEGITFSGNVPVESLQRFLMVRAGTVVRDDTVLRADAPEGFASDALQAMDVLALLSEGQVSFDGVTWSAIGQALEADAEATIPALLGTSAPRWSLTLSDPVVPVEQAAVAPAPVAAAPIDAPTETSEAEPISVVDPAYGFLATLDEDGAVTLSGQVPAEATARYIASLTGGDATNLAVSTGAPSDFARHAQAGLRALLQLRAGQLELADGRWNLTGTAKNSSDKAAIDTQIAALGEGWTTDLTAPSDLAQCQQQVDALSAHNAILFQSGAAIIADSANAELDAFAEALQTCPKAIVDVEGHTDSDGDDQLNLALSVARAEAVVNALIERGVSPARLYAIGYGESMPVADNDTADGKRRNRRIVVSVRDAVAGE